MAWDPTGQRIAVVYGATKSGSQDRSELVAIFQVGSKPFITFTERFVYLQAI